MSVDPFVQQNVDAFLDVFKRVRQQSGRSAVRFRTWIDPETGQLLFAEEGKSPPVLGRKQWQQLDLNCFYDETAHRMRLEEQNPSIVHLAPLAVRIFHDSIRALKQLEDSLPCEVRVSDQLIISKIWYDVDRYRAEDLLFKKPVGTYLFRKDVFAKLLEEQLLRQGFRDLSLWTLTVSMPGRKCSDYTLVHLNHSWQIYNDDPSLTQKTFPGLAQVIQSFKGVCKYPLYNL